MEILNVETKDVQYNKLFVSKINNCLWSEGLKMAETLIGRDHNMVIVRLHTRPIIHLCLNT